MTEPILNFDFTLAEAAARGGWQDANRYCVWVGSETAGMPPYELVERRAEGIVRPEAAARTMRLIAAGTPFRVAHLFAPWHVSDADTVYLRVMREDCIYHLLVATMGPTVRHSHVAWFCPACDNAMARDSFATAQDGLAAFWPFMLERVRAFNAAPERQLCAKCGTRHPPCYGFAAKDDTAPEALARAAW